MSSVLVDTSVWIAYFRGREEEKAIADALAYLISGDEAVVNDVILTELVPFMNVRGETACVDALSALRSLKLDIDWPGLRMLQETCLRNGINKVGMPDLMIAQQSISLGMPIFSLDGHFALMAQCTPLHLWPHDVKQLVPQSVIANEC